METLWLCRVQGSISVRPIQRYSGSVLQVFIDSTIEILQVYADFTPPKSAKPFASTRLDGDFGFHVDGYIFTANKLNICSCSFVGVLFWKNSVPFTVTLFRVI